MANYSQEVLEELAGIRKRLELLMDQYTDNSAEYTELLMVWGLVENLIPAYFDAED